jgi:hypothetical protein
METGKSPCAWFCNPGVEDSGICARSFISSSGGILGVIGLSLGLVLTTAVEPSVQISVAAGAAVLSRRRRVFARRDANYMIRTL